MIVAFEVWTRERGAAVAHTTCLLDGSLVTRVHEALVGRPEAIAEHLRDVERQVERHLARLDRLGRLARGVRVGGRASAAVALAAAAAQAWTSGLAHALPWGAGSIAAALASAWLPTLLARLTRWWLRRY